MAPYAHIESTDGPEPGFVSLRTSTTPSPERRSAIQVRSGELDSVLLDAIREDRE
jgi:hypothetical protein